MTVMPPASFAPASFAPASFAHVAVLAYLQNACFPDDPWPESAFAALLVDPPGFGLIATNTAPVGFALARLIIDEAEIISLGILPASRRRGVGALILNQLTDQCRARGATCLFLEVAAPNLAATTLYRSHGFAEAGKRRQYYPNGDDALVLCRAL